MIKVNGKYQMSEEEQERFRQVLDIVVEADFKVLKKMLEQRKPQKNSRAVEE